MSEEVGFVFLYVIEIGWLLFVFAGLHPFAQAFDGEEPVVHDECPSGAGVVAGSQFKKVAAPEGIKALHEAHPDVDIYLGAQDDHLNENGYIVPGLGDAGDRIYGTK